VWERCLGKESFNISKIDSADKRIPQCQQVLTSITVDCDFLMSTEK
jgi:hypothetical protein